ncbi:tryptophan 7-halogenase [Sphingomonas sp. M1A8_2b]
MPVVAEPKIRVAIVGGGLAGWIAAAALSRVPPHQCSGRLVEAEALPNIRAFDDRLVITTVPPATAHAAMARLTARISAALPHVPSPAAYRAAQTRQLLP